MPCPFFAHALIFPGAAPLLIPNPGSNQCALVIQAHSPCWMTLEGREPDSTLCERPGMVLRSAGEQIKKRTEETGESGAPGYWMWETSGVLRAAVLCYLNGLQLGPQDLSLMRAYCQQWVNATAWDRNPHNTDEDRIELSELRRSAGEISDTASLRRWIERAVEMNMDPL